MPRDYSDPQGDAEFPATNRYVSWSAERGRYRPAGPAVEEVPSGVYNIRVDSNGWFIEPTSFNSDELLHLPGLPIDFILSQIETFWQNTERFANCGLLHKRGILLYGAAGCGKTSIIKLLSNNIVEHNGVVLVVNSPELAANVLSGFRQIEPNRPILTILEDIDVYMDNDGDRRDLLALLDGESQVNHIVHLATTNYPDQLDETVVKRPGRFDVVIELKHPVREAREAYLRSLLGTQLPEEELQRLVEATAGLGLAHLRELVSATYCLGLDTEETLERLKGNVRLKLKQPRVGNDEGLGFSVGFGSRKNDDD